MKMITKNEVHEYKARIPGYQYISWQIIRDQGMRFPLMSWGLGADILPTDPLMC